MNRRYLALVILFIIALLASLSSSCSDTEENQSYGPPQVTFPEDEGSHSESLVEWWYLNATLHDAQGKEYTAMVAYFTPPMRIISISDLETGTFYHDAPLFSEMFSTTSSYAEGGLDLRWGETDLWYRTNSDSFSYRLKAEGETIGLDFEIISEKAPLMVGGDGLVEWTEGSTYYYSLTRLQVEGQIEFAGRTVDVEGTGWMDHQWMGGEALQRGWDWFSIQLDDNTDIICWQIISGDGSVQSRDLTMMFSDESIYHTVDLDIEKVSTWTSPETGEIYGTAWRITEAGQGLDLEITTRYNEQEILMFSDLPEMAWQFWEGGLTVSGEMDGSDVSGSGYAELVPMLGQ
ncbi:lipocalin family protein [Chloroflexota bacterium]